eukprot:1436339-Amphidinium_carterae.1
MLCKLKRIAGSATKSQSIQAVNQVTACAMNAMLQFTEKSYPTASWLSICLLYTSDAADDTPCVDL